MGCETPIYIFIPSTAEAHTYTDRQQTHAYIHTYNNIRSTLYFLDQSIAEVEKRLQ